MNTADLPLLPTEKHARDRGPGLYRIGSRTVFWTGRVLIGIRFTPPPPQPSADAERVQRNLRGPYRRGFGLTAGLLALALQACGGGDPDEPAEIPKPPCAASREACV